MSDDIEDAEELDEIDLDEEIGDDLDDEIELDDDLDDDLGDDLGDDLDADPATMETPVGTKVVKEDDEDEDVLDLEEELHPDDVEAPLDALLQERTASATLEDDEEEVEDDEADPDERGDTPTRIAPRRPTEFLCQACFLVLPRHQLADEKRTLCRDCA